MEFYYDGGGKKREPFRGRFPLVRPKEFGRKKGFDDSNLEEVPRFVR